MSTAGIKAGRAFVEITTNNKALSRGLAAAQAQLKAFGDTTKGVGITLAAAGASAGLPFAASVKTFAEFEKTMSRVKALTNASASDFDKLNTKAKDLGEQTVFSATQAAEAMAFFALAGFKTDQIMQAVGPTLDLAAAGQLEMAEAADITAKIMAGMGIEAKDVGNAVDVLTKAMTTANTDLRQLGDAMKFVGPIAKSVGVGIEDITAAIQLLSNAGIQGEMAGTTLRGTLLSLTDPSKEAAELMKKLGISAIDAQGNVRPLAAIVDNFNAALEGMGKGAKLGIVGRIFDARQAAGFVELMSQGGDALRKASTALRSSDGTAAKIAGTQINNLAGDAIIATSAFEGLQIAVGEALVGPLRILTKNVTQIIGISKAWIKENRDVVLTVTAAAAGLIVAGGAFLSLAVGIKIASVALAAALVPLHALVAVIGIATSPLAIVTAGVVGLYAAFIDLGQVARDASNYLAEAFASLKDRSLVSIYGIRDALAGGDLSAAAKILWLSLKTEWLRGTAALGGVWDNFRDGFMNAWSNTVSFFSASFLTAVGAMRVALANFGEYLDNVGNQAAHAFDGLKGGLEAWQAGIEIGRIEVQRTVGKITDLEANQQIAAIDQAVFDKKSGRAKAEAARAKEIADTGQGARESIVADVAGQIKIIKSNEAADRKARTDATQAGIDEATAAVAKVSGELAEAVAASKAAAAARTAATDPLLPTPAERGKAAVDAGAAVAAEEVDRSTSGTFSARGAEAMGGGAVAEIKKSNITLAQMREILQRLYAANGTLGGLA